MQIRNPKGCNLGNNGRNRFGWIEQFIRVASQDRVRNWQQSGPAAANAAPTEGAKDRAEEKREKSSGSDEPSSAPSPRPASGGRCRSRCPSPHTSAGRVWRAKQRRCVRAGLAYRRTAARLLPECRSGPRHPGSPKRPMCSPSSASAMIPKPPALLYPSG